MKIVYIIPCGKSKIFKNDVDFEEAKNAYTGATFKYSKNICEKMNFEYLIFSAKYGLILPSHMIQNYNISFKNKKDICITINELECQFNNIILNKYQKIVTFCGNEYNKQLNLINKTVIIEDFFESLENKSMGFRLSYLKNYYDNINKNNINDIF